MISATEARVLSEENKKQWDEKRFNEALDKATNEIMHAIKCGWHRTAVSYDWSVKEAHVAKITEMLIEQGFTVEKSNLDSSVYIISW